MMWCSGKRVELAEVAIKMGLQLLERFYRNPLNKREKADPEAGNERKFCQAGSGKLMW